MSIHQWRHFHFDIFDPPTPFVAFFTLKAHRAVATLLLGGDVILLYVELF